MNVQLFVYYKIYQLVCMAIDSLNTECCWRS